MYFILQPVANKYNYENVQHYNSSCFLWVFVPTVQGKTEILDV